MDYNYPQPPKSDNKSTIIIILLVVLIVMLAVGLTYIITKDSNNRRQAEPQETTEQTAQPQHDTTQVALSTASTNTTPAPAPPQPTQISDIYDRSSYHLTGTIAGKNVVMELSHSGSSLWGSYYYTKHGNTGSLTLDGTLSGNGKVYLTETNISNGMNTGWIDARLNRDGSLTGKFTNMRGNTYNIRLRVR